MLRRSIVSSSIVTSSPIRIRGLPNLAESTKTVEKEKATTIDYEDYGVGWQPTIHDLHDPCVQFSALGDAIPYEYVDILAKVVFEVENFDKVSTSKSESFRSASSCNKSKRKLFLDS